MAKAAVERYREHVVWESLRLKADALEQNRYSTPDLELRREMCISILRHALQSVKNPQEHLYDDVLDSLLSLLTGLEVDEYSFSRYSIPSLADSVRRLPGPPPRMVLDKYRDALDESVAVRQEDLAEIRRTIGGLEQELAMRQTQLMAIQNAADAAKTSLDDSVSRIAQVADDAQKSLNLDWNARVKEWEAAREKKDAASDELLAEQVALLVVAAQVGQRLVEHAAGRFTALDWTTRATRERRSGTTLRRMAIVAFVAAVLVGAYIVARSLQDGFTLTLGDGVLRTGIILSIAGVGGYLSAESRRHFKEADSAEEVATALGAIEPFYASSDEAARSAARVAVGQTVFVRNVLSRFTSRDAAKHSGVSNQEMTDMLDTLSKGLDVSKKVSGAP